MGRASGGKERCRAGPAMGATRIPRPHRWFVDEVWQPVIASHLNDSPVVTRGVAGTERSFHDKPNERHLGSHRTSMLDRFFALLYGAILVVIASLGVFIFT